MCAVVGLGRLAGGSWGKSLTAWALALEPSLRSGRVGLQPPAFAQDPSSPSWKRGRSENITPYCPHVHSEGGMLLATLGVPHARQVLRHIQALARMKLLKASVLFLYLRNSCYLFKSEAKD